MLTTDLVSVVVRQWYRFFRATPRLTIVITAAAAIIGVIIPLVVELTQPDSLATESPPANELTNQLEALDLVQDSLQNLLGFVQNQKREIEIEQETITELAQERSQLESAVQIDRATVEELAKIIENRGGGIDWKTIGIGFGFGILASTIASLTVAYGREKLQAT